MYDTDVSEEKIRIQRTYKINAKDFKITTEEFKQRIKPKSNRIKRYTCWKKTSNKMFFLLTRKTEATMMV